MQAHECYHCKQWVEEDEAHNCWSTTETALTRDLSDDLREAWERLRETATEFGEQRIYASHHCIMFSRKACYFFVRPRRNVLELCFFLARPIKAPQIRRVARPSQRKVAHIVHVRHRDEVEAPITDWLQEAYEASDALSGKATRKAKARVPGKRTVKRGRRSTKRAKKGRN
jgi:Domain of unknown function (DUF5655)